MTSFRIPLTEVERETLKAIQQDIIEGIQPTLRSISKRRGVVSHSTAQVAVDRLEKHGYLRRAGSRKQIVVVKAYKWCHIKD